MRISRIQRVTLPEKGPRKPLFNYTHALVGGRNPLGQYERKGFGLPEWEG